MRADDPYLMPDANVLQNCLGEQNQSALLEHEIFFSGLRISELLYKPLSGNLDYPLLQRIHYYIFQDVYPAWAGTTRTVKIFKPERTFHGNSVEYADPGVLGAEIEGEARLLFEELRQERWLTGLASPRFCEKLSYYLSRLWKIHPFREGNTRSIMVFIYYLASRAGFVLSLSYFDRKHTEIRKNLVLSTTGETGALCQCLQKAIVNQPAS